MDKSLNESKDTGTDNKDKTYILMSAYVDFEGVGIKKSPDKSLNEWIMYF